MRKADSAASIFKAAQTLREEERKKLRELMDLVSAALQRETDPTVRQDLQRSLEEAQQALDADARNTP